MVKFWWRYDNDGLFFKRCGTDVFWTNVSVPTNAIIWTQLLLTMFFDVMIFKKMLVFTICLGHFYGFSWFLFGFHCFSRYCVRRDLLLYVIRS